jgi:hypothetical protein
MARCAAGVKTISVLVDVDGDLDAEIDMIESSV